MDKWVIRDSTTKSKLKDHERGAGETSSKKWKPSYEDSRNASVSKELLGKWMGKYKWLRVEDKDGKNSCYCNWCIETKRSNTLITGAYVTKADVLTKHERGEDHQFAKASYVSDEPIKSWGKAVAAANDKVASAVKGVMNIVYYQAKENIATRKTKSLKELCQDLGADYLKDLQVDKHTNYESYDAVHDMEDAIARVIKDRILNRIQNSRWYSVCLDESTDVSVTQSVIIYVKSVNKGKLWTDFLQLESLSGCTAPDIYNAVSGVLKEFNIDYKKLSSVGSDGASVMTGCRNGVATHFQQHNSYMIPVHCVAHRLALARGQAADTIPYLLKFQEIMNKVFKYFEYSAKRTRNLKQVQGILDQAEKKFVQIFHTRWLTFFGSLQALHCNWSALVTLLMQDKSAVAQGLLKSLTSYKFLACAAFLSDVLYIINQLCVTFQKEDLNLSTVLTQVDACVGELKNIQDTHTGTKYMDFRDNVPKLAHAEGFEYEGHHVRDSEAMRKETLLVFDQFMGHVICNIEERLGNLGQIGIFTFMLPCNIPEVYSPNFGAYGAEEITQVSVHFKDHVFLGDHANLGAEWNLLKRILSVRCKAMNLRELVKFLYDNAMADLYPHMVSVYEFLLSLPMSTVDCERGFSVMNLTKTVLRNRMSIPHLSNLMMISVNGDEISVNGDEAFKFWCLKKERRVAMKCTSQCGF